MLDVRDALRATRLAVQRHEHMVDAALDVAGGEAIRSVYASPGFTRRTGKAQDLTTTRVIRTSGGKLVRIAANASYAGVLEGGSKPHTIEAKGGGFLTFKIGSNWIRTKSVSHPGTPAFHTWSRAQEAGAAQLEIQLERGMARISQNFGR